MLNKGYLRFFSIERCGFYKFSSVDTNAYGGEIEESLDLIQKWVTGRPVSQTMPWSAEARKNKPKCYCRDIYKDERTNDFLIVLWKSDTTSEGSLLGIEEDSIGSSSQVFEIDKNHRGRNLIWGQPCYYWVITDLNIVVSIKFDNSVTDASLFQEYLIGCVGHRVEHRFRKKEQTENGHVRFRYIDNETCPNTNLFYRFQMHQIVANTSNLPLSEIANKTSQIIRRITVETNAKDDREIWLKLFDRLPFISGKANHKNRRIEVVYDAKPTPDEVQQIIDEGNELRRDGDQWDNIGFLDDKKAITWVDTYILKDSLSVSHPQAGGVYTASELYDFVYKKRSRFIGLFDSSVNHEFDTDNFGNEESVSV